MSWEAQYQPRIDADIAALTPLHDFVLVQEIETPSAVIKSPIHMTRDYRWRSNRPTGLRYGTVVAIGKGDRLFGFACVKCHGSTWRVETARHLVCRMCGGDLAKMENAPRRAEMHCKVGDVVIYPRIPANDVEINGEVYTFAHEEQHILAVVDEQEAA